uniref:Granulins domain-containing protein n=1 Tax=Sinocyclocheilus grahami TaxID=75366 RepID=A0A672KBM4_SINGR
MYLFLFIIHQVSLLKLTPEDSVCVFMWAVICPDEISTCLDDTTCCELDTGSYGCCPMPKVLHTCIFNHFSVGLYFMVTLWFACISLTVRLN